MSTWNVESILEEKFHEKNGRVGKVFGVEITTRFSKEALVGMIAMLADMMKEKEEDARRHHEMMSFFQANKHG
jgi:hypothetical protein